MSTENYSSFPTTIDTYKELYDVGYEQLTDIRRYQELKQKQYLTSVEQVELSELATRLMNFIFTSNDINKVTGSLTTMQRYFRDETVPQLEAWKQEIVDYNTEYQTLSQTISQSWTTTSATTYDIHSGNETLDSSIELKLDASSNLTVIVDGVVIAYNKYEIRTNTSSKKTIIAFIGYTPTSGKRMEARWSYASRQFVVGGHQHNKSDIVGLPTVATTGSYGDLSNIPSTFTPSTHTHTWSQVSGKPSTYTPSSHTHDDRYYTESEMDTKLKAKSNTGHVHTVSEVTGLQSEIDSLKSSVVNGKQTVANAINDKAGSSLSFGNTFNEMATAVSEIQIFKQEDIVGGGSTSPVYMSNCRAITFARQGGSICRLKFTGGISSIGVTVYRVPYNSDSVISYRSTLNLSSNTYEIEDLKVAFIVFDSPVSFNVSVRETEGVIKIF